MKAARARSGLCLVAGALALGLTASSWAQNPIGTAKPAAAVPADSWLSRLIQRHFGNTRQTGEDLQGQALQTADRYAQYAGRPIEVVLIHQVAAFPGGEHPGAPPGAGILGTLTDPLQTYTRDGTIRRTLLFERGQELDPYALADSERLLRNLPFISDVRILVVPLSGEPQAVAVVVQTRDRWPIGADLKVTDSRRVTGGLYSVNVLGQGLGLRNDVIYNADGVPHWGYRGRLNHDNVGGSFLAAEVEFEDSWQVLRRQIQLQRALVHPGIGLVGGATLARTDDRDNQGVPRKFDQADLWLGRALLVARGGGRGEAARPQLVPAVGVSHVFFLRRPPVGPQQNTSYHDRRLYLAGLTFQRLKDYKTSYLYRMGETEDVPAGLFLKGTLGYEHGQFQERVCGWLEAEYVSIRNRGDLVFTQAGYGGYLRNSRLEEGVLSCRAGLVTPAAPLGTWRRRHSLQVSYTLGIDRPPDQALSLGDRAGIRGQEDDRFVGFQRAVATLESRLFAPWTFQGFRCMLMVYADAGAICGQREPLLRQRFALSCGLGMRLHNPDLVFPAIDLRVGMLRSLAGHGLVLALDLGQIDPPGLAMPSVKPEPLAFR